MQTALHITSLVAELSQEVVGARIVSTEFYKKQRAAFIFLKAEKKRWALGLVYHPAGSGCYLVPASKVRIETREKPWPFFELEGGHVEAVAQLGVDRIFELRVAQSNETKRVVYECLGPNGNLWLLDSEGVRRATLRKRELSDERPYAPPPSDRLDPFALTGEQLARFDEEYPDTPLVRLLEKRVSGLNRTLALEVLYRLDDESDLDRASDMVRESAARFKAPEKGYLYVRSSGMEAYPFRPASLEITPERFKSLSLAVKAGVETSRTVVAEVDERKTLTEIASRTIRSLKRRIKKIESDLEKAADFEKYRRTAELLQTNFDVLARGMTEITVVDVFYDSSQEETITLDPALSPTENVAAYAKRYRKGRDGHALMQRRLEVSEAELAKWNTISQDLVDDFEAARQRYAEELDGARPRSAKAGATAPPRLPYREYQLSSGVRIYVGRDGADNDRTTFEHAKPYELWFHTQQCPGSHVVIKFPNKSFKPSKAEIQETAAVAAYHSKARHDSLVPVVYTERRYVRKPRKAKPGLVTVEREKSIMVTPAPPPADA